MVPSGRGIATLLAIVFVALPPGGPPSAAGQGGGAASAPGREQPAATAPRPKPPTFELQGRVELLEKGKRSTDRSLVPRNTVVLFEPTRKSTPPKPVTVEMTTVKKEFSPRLLVVPVGSTVRFPNSDPILHNVFSISGKNSFDLGLVSKGPGKTATFPEPGIVRVFCNVHHAMFAYIYVVASPHWTTVADDGSFRIAGIPAGPGRLTVWNERSAPATSDVTLPVAAPLELGVEITMPRIPPHKNKLGKSYGGQNYG
jgi:plastocyanin